MCLVYGLLVLCIAAADARATESVTDQNILANNSCEDVRQVYVEKNIGTEKDASDMTHEDSRLNNAFRLVEWAQNEIAVVPDFYKRILFSDEAHFWLNGYVNKQNCRIWSEANPQVYVETPLHPEKLTVWCALLAGGILLQKR
ncbi:uncharacterized protein TNCV_1871171 [Trichonephila clavipes]|nr:uncharacterized protein TNCV_1871171 [Trichonephila clavipes]